MNASFRRLLHASRRWRAACALLVCVWGVPRTARAQVIAETERLLLSERAGALAGAAAGFWDGLAELRKQEDRQRSLKADISFGLTGDEAGPRSLFKINTGITLSRGDFPSEVTVVSKLGLQQRDGQLQEDVTTLLISYDYHTAREVEYFAFAERFSDSFLSIQQRYEVGFGTRIGRHFGHVPGWARTARSFAGVRDNLAFVTGASARMSARTRQALPALTDDEPGSFTRAVDQLEHALRDRAARLFVGVVASAFAELERAEIEATSTPAAGGGSAITSKVAVDATHRYRLSLRPAVVVRPSDEVEIVVFPYFKLPIDGPRRVTAADGSRRLDYRRDVLSSMEWTIKEERTGLEAVGLLLTINHFFDNVPPRLPDRVVQQAAADGRVFDRLEAERSHRVVALSLKLKW